MEELNMWAGLQLHLWLSNRYNHIVFLSLSGLHGALGMTFLL